MERNAPARRQLAFAFSIGCGAVLAACGSTTASTSPTAPPSAASATSAGTSALPTCPTGAVVSAVAGGTYPNPEAQSSANFLTCTYSDTTSGANLVIAATTEPGGNASTVQAV